MNTINVKKWFVLAGVAAVLLIVPRRSSQKADTKRSNKRIVNAANDEEVTTINK